MASTKTPGTTSSITSRSAGSFPIVGPDLLRVDTDQGPRLLYEWLAEKLAVKLSVDPTGLPQPLTLNDVVCSYLGQRGRREEAYTRLRSIMREVQIAPPMALRQLAQITDFDLFITTTFDPLLEQAVNLERFGGQPHAEVIAYAPNRVSDLPAERSQLQRPVVYHMLGKLSASPTYVVSDEDMLEFICALQSEHLTPEKLFHELEHSHLLLIGSDFSNWLARLFLRMAKRKRLSDPRDFGEILADDHTSKDERLLAFLQQVSVRTRVFSGAESFVAELHQRWLSRQQPAAATSNMGLAPQRFLPPAREMPENAIFISYAREDLAAVQRLKAALDAAGLVTWFDLDRLEGGDDYDRKIRANIGRCSFFLPVISGSTQRRHEAYFRREWSYAVDRSRNIAEGAVFILPVCIDDTTEADALVPEKFKAVHISRLPGGEPSPEFIRRLQELSSGAPFMKHVQPDIATETTIDPENPWLGLSSYSEETRAYFHGRDEEAAELARRVQRKLLTVLFGQSGLGKTSLLRAGLVPRLRGVGLLSRLRPHRLRAGIAAAGRPDQAGDLQGDGRGRLLDARGFGRRRRIAVGVPASPGRPAARCERTDAVAAADLRPVRGDLHAGAGRRRRPAAREALPR